MKTYIQPETRIVTLKPMQMMALSTGIGTGKALGNEYTDTDVSYGRESNSWDIWGSGDYEED